MADCTNNNKIGEFKNMNLKVLEGGKDLQQEKAEERRFLVMESYGRIVERVMNQEGDIRYASMFERMKVCYYTIKLINTVGKDIREENYEITLSLFGMICELLQDMPVEEFMRWFPAKKVYDGEKYGCKDYYSTMEIVEKYPNITNPEEFLMEYYNYTIHLYMVNVMMAISAFCRAEGKETPMETFCRKNGIPVYYGQELPNGKTLLTSSDGSQKIMNKRKPRKNYLKVMNGGMEDE